MTISGINQIVLSLDGALRQLGKTVSMPEVERLAIQIHRTMDHPNRAYHTSRHLLDVCQGASPLATLAGIYHDIAYFQLDGGFPTDILPGLSMMVERLDHDFVLRLGPDAGLPLRLAASVFGFSDRSKLPLLGGLNEFVSAVIAASVLEAWLTPAELLTVIGCIEATVPFRPLNADGLNMPESLCHRLTRTNSQFGLGCSDEQLRGIAGEAIALANRDVGGFAEPDPAQFLSNTWLLIEESNAALVAVGVYTVRDYRQALGRMEGFLSFLNPDNVFHTFDPLSPSDEFLAQAAAARRNLEFARRYLAGKLSALAIIEALAQLTGGDCPISMLLGDIAIADQRSLRIEDFLPVLAEHPDIDQQMLDVFDQGRRAVSLRDSSQSPLSAYVYRYLGEAGTMALFAQAKALFGEKTSPEAFLQQLDSTLRKAIAQSCAKIAISRATLLNQLAG